MSEGKTRNKNVYTDSGEKEKEKKKERLRLSLVGTQFTAEALVRNLRGRMVMMAGKLELQCSTEDDNNDERQG